MFKKIFISFTSVVVFIMIGGTIYNLHQLNTPKIVIETVKVETSVKPQLNLEEVIKSSVSVSCGIGEGSGTVIAKDESGMYILTCWHVVDFESILEETIKSLFGDVKPEEMDSIKELLKGIGIQANYTIKYDRINVSGSEQVGITAYRATIIKVDKAHDLALLLVQADDKNLPVLPISLTKPKLGDTVFAIGNPLGIKRNVTKGIVSNRIYSKDFDVIDASITFGNSGGTVINGNGELIGVPSQVPGYDKGIPESNLGFVVKWEVIVNFLKEFSF